LIRSLKFFRRGIVSKEIYGKLGSVSLFLAQPGILYPEGVVRVTVNADGLESYTGLFAFKYLIVVSETTEHT
jgi:hypothetical protein